MRILYAVRIGDKDWQEQIIAEGESQIKVASEQAKQNGFDRLRVAEIDLDKRPDAKMFAETVRQDAADRVVAAALVDTEIGVGNSVIVVKTHANAPDVVNYYDVRGNARRYNTNPLRMKYTQNPEWVVRLMNSQTRAKCRVYYHANVAKKAVA